MIGEGIKEFIDCKDKFLETMGKLFGFFTAFVMFGIPSVLLLTGVAWLVAQVLRNIYT